VTIEYVALATTVQIPAGPSTNGHKPHGGDDFWSQRPVLTHLHQAALARRVSPWAVLGVALVNVIAATPPFVVLPPIVAGRGSLNTFIALVGDSGSGKGGATTTATETLITTGCGQAFSVHTLGSGQGVAHAYGKRERDGTLTRHTTSCVFIAPEIDAIGATIRQSGSTLLPELRSVWMGEPLGKFYVDPAKRIEIEAHTYRAGLIAHVQPGRAGVLLDDADGGTPQRFLWLPTTFPHADLRPEGPAEPWSWRCPVWKSTGTEPGVTLPVCAAAWGEIDDSVLARARGQGDPLDGHRLFCQEKVAAALGILDGRAEVTDDDWSLAQRVMAVSDTTRATVLAELKSVATRAHHDKAHGAAVSAVAVDDALADAAIKRVLKVLPRHIPRAPDSIGRAELRRRVNSRDRDFVDDALTRLLGTGGVLRNRSSQGTVYQRPAEES
jgi:hypothetical protein